MTADQLNQSAPKSVTPPTPQSRSNEPTDSSVKRSQPDHDSRRMMWIGAGSVVGGLLVLLIVLMVSFYTFNWQNNFTRSVVKALRLPVALYGAQTISYADYQEDIDTLNYFYRAQAEENPGVLSVPTESFIQKSVLSRLIREHFTANQAAVYGVSVSQDEIDSEYTSVVQQAPDEQEVIDTLRSLYNWTPDQFKQKVLYPYLLRFKLAEKIATDDTINADTKKQAEDVLRQISSGTLSFEDAARQYSADTTASTGGDLGYFSTGAMVPEFETAAFALDVDEISNVVQTQYGYHIIKLTERVAATDDAPEQVRASHILFQTADLDTWTNEQLAGMYTLVLLKGLEWKDDCGLVLGMDETCEINELLDLANSQQQVSTTPSDTTPTDETNTNTGTDDTTEQPTE